MPGRREHLYLFDTTLRDGQQSAGVDFSLNDKIGIATRLDELGLDYIEGGYPGANQTDTNFFSKKHKLNFSKMTAFGMTKRAGRSADNDPGLAQILNAESDAVCLVAKSWDFHVEVALRVSQEENLESIRESVKAIVARDKEAMIDCEHFFDGYKSNPDYALKCAMTALEAGARWVVLCDTNGGTLPFEIYDIITKITKHIDGEQLGIHAHNDTENAVANSLAAIDAGVRQVQGTVNGLGERCGNANIVSLIPTLMLKPFYNNRFKISIPEENLSKLTKISRYLDDILNQTPNRHQPYVGASAFAHKGGIHVSAVMKDPTTYEHINPELVGNERQIQISDQAGRSNIVAMLDKHNIKASDDEVTQIFHKTKEHAEKGYNYDDAEASFLICAQRLVNPDIMPFSTTDYTFSGNDECTEVNLSLLWYGQKQESKGEGIGPVNAVDDALRKILKPNFDDGLQNIKLVNFKVHILDVGTTARTRVLIESSDGQSIWRTVGIADNIISASLDALIDAYLYKLLYKKS